MCIMEQYNELMAKKKCRKIQFPMLENNYSGKNSSVELNRHMFMKIVDDNGKRNKQENYKTLNQLLNKNSLAD